MPKVLDNGRFRVYIYANDSNPHHLPHCHVYWNGDDHASVVSLPDLVVIAGDALPGRHDDCFRITWIGLCLNGFD